MDNPYTEKLRTVVERLRDLEQIYENLRGWKPGLPDSDRLIAYDEYIVLLIGSLKELPDAHKAIREAYDGNYSYKLKQSWHSLGNIIMVEWSDSKNPLVKIWMQTDVENYPQELLPKGKGCSWKEVEKSEWKLVCDVPDSEGS